MATLVLGGRRRRRRRRLAAGRHLASRRDALGRCDRLADRRAGGVVRRPARSFGASGPAQRSRARGSQQLHVTASTEGAPIPRLYGRVRLGGQSSGPTDFEEEQVTTDSGRQGKGRQAAARVKRSTEYRYFANFAVALCEGEITGIGRVWADGKELDLARVVYRAVHRQRDAGARQSDQRARWARQCAPAYRGTAYVVFEDLPLARFGNRLPQLSFEVFRAGRCRFGEQIRGVVTDPGLGRVRLCDRAGRAACRRGRSQRGERAHAARAARTGRSRSTSCRRRCPTRERVSLVVALVRQRSARGPCQLKPGVERRRQGDGAARLDASRAWRAPARIWSATRDGRPAYGGTPSDQPSCRRSRS